MQPGDIHIYLCPTCGNLLAQESILSSNNFGEKIYSDGKRISLMQDEEPLITICSKCNNIFWFNDLKKIGSYDVEEKIPSEWVACELARELTVYEYFQALKTIVRTKDEELFIRQSIWWGFNDRERNKEEFFTSPDDKVLWLSNAIKLIALLDTSIADQKLMVAELHRNMGNFIKCEEILQSIDDNDTNWVKEALLSACMNKNPNVLRLQ